MTEEERLELEEKTRLEEEQRLAEENINLKAIEDLKAKLDKAVDPIEHAKLKADYKALMTEYTNRRPAQKVEEVKLRPVIEIAKELQNIESGDISNREYIVKSLEYREAHLKEFGTDPWTNFSSEGAEEATADTKEVAKVLQDLVNENESAVDFRIKLNSVLKDDPKLIQALNKKNKRK